MAGRGNGQAGVAGHMGHAHHLWLDTIVPPVSSVFARPAWAGHAGNTGSLEGVPEYPRGPWPHSLVRGMIPAPRPTKQPAHPPSSVNQSTSQALPVPAHNIGKERGDWIPAHFITHTPRTEQLHIYRETGNDEIRTTGVMR